MAGECALHLTTDKGNKMSIRDGDSRQHWVLPAGGGDLGSMKLEQAAISEPVYGEMQIRVEAIGLNFADVFSALGLYGPIKSGEIKGRFCPGLEFAGVVEKIPGFEPEVESVDTLNGEVQLKRGSQLVKLDPQVWEIARETSHKFRVGDRVYGATRFGAFATRLNIPAHQVRKIPPKWSFEQAAGFAVQTLTVYYALKELGAIAKDKAVLIHSAAGGCGMNAIQVCERMGAHVVGTVSSQDKVELLLKLFPFLKREQLIIRKPTGKEFEQQLRMSLVAIGKEDGFDIVLDAVLGEYFHPGMAALKSGGRYIVYGAASFTPTSDSMSILEWIKLGWQWLWRPKIDPLELPGMNKSIMGFNLIHCLNNAKTLMQLMDEIDKLNLEPPHIDRVFKFHEMVDALRHFRTGQTKGKLIVKV